MSALEDAKSLLDSVVVDSLAFLSGQDDPATLATTLAPLAAVQGAVAGWIQATTSLHAMNAKTEQEFNQAMAAEPMRDLRRDAQGLIEHAAEIGRLVVAFAQKARASQADAS